MFVSAMENDKIISYANAYMALANAVHSTSQLKLISRDILMNLSYEDLSGIKIISLTNLLTAAESNKIALHKAIGDRSGMGVVVSPKLYSLTMSEHTNLLMYLEIRHGTRMFGICECSTGCYASRIFHGTVTCQEIIEKIMLLNRIVIPDLAFVIRSKLLA